MIEFKIDYNREPWISKDWKSKHLIVASVHAMAEYMINRAKKLDQIINTILANGMIRPTRHEDAELQTILSILKDAGIEIVKDGE